MSKRFLNVDLDDIAQDDPWVKTVAATSTLPSQMGELTSDDVLTTDETYAAIVFIDASPSMRPVQQAVIHGVEGDPNSGHLGLIGNLHKLSRTERPKLRLAMLQYNDRVTSFYDLTRVFVPDPSGTGLDIRNPAIPELNHLTYNPNSGFTNTIAAIRRATADAIAYEAEMAHDEFEQPTKLVVAGVTDGLCNRGTAFELAEFRTTIARKLKSESWTFIMFCIATLDTVAEFRRHVDNSQVSDYIAFLIEERGYENDTEPNPSTGETYTAEDYAWAQYMYECMATGWGAYTDSKANVAGLTGRNGDIARMYLLGEEALVEMTGQWGFSNEYTAIGGFAIPRQNVESLFFEPERISEMLGIKLSSSIMASVGLTGADPSTPPADADDSATDDDPAW